MTDICCYGSDYETKFDAQAFLNSYCTENSFCVKEGSVVPVFHKIFSSFEFLPGSKLLEFGCGPCIYGVLSASDKFEEITMADYATCNREAVNRWLERSEGAHDWTAVLATLAKLEGKSDPKIIEDRVRRAIKHVVHCDITRTDFLPADHMGPYDFIVSNLCLDAACKTVAEYKAAGKRLLTCLKPGGGFVLSAMVGCSYYYVGDQKFFGLCLTREEVIGTIEEASLVLESVEFNHLDVLAGANDHAGYIIVHGTKPR